MDDQSRYELKSLQDAIYRDQVNRARQMSMEERFNEALNLSNQMFLRMHEGAMWQLQTTDPDLGWEEVERRLDRLRKQRDHGRYTTAGPQADDH